MQEQSTDITPKGENDITLEVMEEDGTPRIIWTTHNHIIARSRTINHNANNALKAYAPPKPVPFVRSNHHIHTSSLY